VEVVLSFNNRVLKTGALAAAVTIAFAIFVYGAADWIHGLHSDTATCSISENSTHPAKIIPQIVLGSFGGESTTYVTIIQIVNTSGVPQDVGASFFKEDGTALDNVTFTAEPNKISKGVLSPVLIPKDGVLVINAGGPGMPGTLGWGRITTCGTANISAFYETRDNTFKKVFSRVSVTASPSNMSSFVIPRIRERSTNLDTAFAIVNTASSGSAVLRAELMDATGSVIAGKDISMPAGLHKSLFVHKDLFPSLTETDGRTYQHLKFSSTSPTFAATAFVIEDGKLTGLPVEPN
jgi:hypothetical protein